MRSSIAAFTLAGTLVAAAHTHAQGPAPGGANPPAGASAGRRAYAPRLPFGAGGEASRDPNVKAAAMNIAPVPIDQLKGPTIPLPEEPIEPYLLTKDVGPFMVLAKTFRGPDAERFALALVLELRRDYGLPAFILRTKDFANRSLVRNVPPTAPAGLPRPNLAVPEKFRTFDEAAVLVGNEKTLEDSERLLHQVKKIKPKCIEGLPHLFDFKRSLKGAIRTTNPYVPAQNLFPGRRDKLVEQLNQGDRSIYHCPGRYSLEIAQFTGRATFDVESARLMSTESLKKSPLADAYDEAERFAQALAKIPEIRQTGQPVYVYHDRRSSRVFIGSFSDGEDPAAVKLREYLLKQAIMIADRKDGKSGKPLRGYDRGINRIITPATYLTDLDDPQVPIRPTK